MRILKWLKYPNVLITASMSTICVDCMPIVDNFQNIAFRFLSWSQFALLAAPRHIITTRFQLNTPILAGLFYLSPACGFLAGTILGGRASDMTGKRWIRKRNGLRLPEDRLRGGVVSFFILMPAGYLAFGWGIECDECSRVRLAVPIITAFVVAAGVFDAMTSLNTYCSEVLPHARRDVIAGKFLVQYTSAIASAVGPRPLSLPPNGWVHGWYLRVHHPLLGHWFINNPCS